MSERIAAGPAGALVRIELMAPRGMITLRADLSDGKLARAVKSATGIKPPGKLGVTEASGRALAWMSPDELMLLCPREEAAAQHAALTDALSGHHALIVDVSDARAGFRLSGGPVREVVAKLCPLDLHPGAFGPGTLRRTRMAQVSAAVWMPDAQSLNVLCFRSVAAYVQGVLEAAAAPGSAVGYFGTA